MVMQPVIFEAFEANIIAADFINSHSCYKYGSKFVALERFLKWWIVEIVQIRHLPVIFIEKWPVNLLALLLIRVEWLKQLGLFPVVI